jgi:large subunit ribosomal protein L25
MAPFRPNLISSVMEALILKVSDRDSVGTGASKRIRSEGKIPTNLYGPSGNRNLAVEASEFRVFYAQVRGQSALFEIEDADGKKTRCLIEEVQVNPISRQVSHIDLREIAKGVEIHAHVPVHTKGISYGVKNQGGVLEIVAHQLEVRCLPRHLPKEIAVDVTDLKIHQSVHVRDLVAPEGVVILNPGDEVVVSCATAGKIETTTETEQE